MNAYICTTTARLKFRRHQFNLRSNRSPHLRRCLLVALCMLLSPALYAGDTATTTDNNNKTTVDETVFNPNAPSQRWLNTQEIETYLGGFFVKGVFHGTQWSSYFSPTGSTTFLASSRPPSYGEWKAEDNQYCSQWPPSGGWDCYRISADGEEVTFVPLDGGDPWSGTRSKT